MTHTAVDLKNGERVYYDQNHLQRVIHLLRTTLTAFFLVMLKLYCYQDSVVRRNIAVLHVENSSKQRIRRWQSTCIEGWHGVRAGDAIGRIYTAHI